MSGIVLALSGYNGVSFESKHPTASSKCSLLSRMQAIFQKHQGELEFGQAVGLSKDGKSYLLLDNEMKLIGLQTPKEAFRVVERFITTRSEVAAIREILASLTRYSVDEVQNLTASTISFNGLVSVRKIELA